MNDQQRADQLTSEALATPGIFSGIAHAFSTIPDALGAANIAQRHLDAFKHRTKAKAGDVILTHFTDAILAKLPFGVGMMVKEKVSDEVLGMFISQLVTVGVAMIRPRLSEEQNRYATMILDVMVYGCQEKFLRWSGLDELVNSFLTPDVKAELDKAFEA